ncbi:MAG: PAS domain-containing protein, partial [Syntrophobacteraceae bacterium]|nr:PAS domain-containing protein [Syntrophobacteraceae bacterium]
AVLGPSRDFLARYRDELFPGTPVLYVDIDTRLLDGSLLLSPGAVVTGRFDFEGTLDVALGLHPDVRDVFVVSGESDVDRAMEKLALEAFRGFGDRVRFHSLRGLSMERLLQKVSGLPEPSILFFLTFYRDADERTFLSPQAVSMISEKSNVPVYGMSEYFIGAGMVGGRVYSFSRLGEKTAQSALRLLSSERPEQIEPLEERADRVIFDWRQLKRWSISEASLPPGSIIRNKDFSVWETYRLQILGIASGLVLQAALIGALVVNLARRRKANQALTRSERNLQRATDEWKTTFDSIQDPIMVLDRKFRIARVNQATVSFFDLPLDRILGQTADALVFGKGNPFNRSLLERSHETRGQEEEEVFDETREAWFLASVSPILDGKGQIIGFLHSARDISERRRAEAEALRDRGDQLGLFGEEGSLVRRWGAAGVADRHVAEVLPMHVDVGPLLPRGLGPVVRPVDAVLELHPRGTPALRYELQQKGISPDIIRAVLADLPPDELAYAAARQRAARWRQLDAVSFRQKMS